MSESRWTLLAAAVVGLFAILAVQQAGVAPDLGFDSLGSAAVPRFVGIALLVLVALMLVEQFALGGAPRGLADRDETATATPDASFAEPTPRWSIGLRATTACVGFVAYIALLSRTGIPFWLATLIYVYLASRVLEGGTGRGRIASLIVAAVIGIGVQLIFTRLLLIDLP